MNRYDEQRSRGDRDRDNGRDRRPERESSRDDEVPARRSFYPSAGYGFNPGEYQGSDSAYAGRGYGQDAEYGERNRDFDREPGREPWRGSGQRYSERDSPSRDGPEYSPDTSYGRSGSHRPRQGWGFWGRGDAGYSRSASGRTYAGSAGAPERRRYQPGPKGYTRSDERLREDISEHLMSSYDIDSSEVTVTVKDGRVTLDGSVPERWMKHSIEDVADHCIGVRDVDNRVRVIQEGSTGIVTASGKI